MKKTDSISVSDDVPLMTYYYYDYRYSENEEKKDYRAFGYINEETFEVVIPAQYDAALPFVGNFAIVQDEKDKIYVINKRNEKIFSMGRNMDFARIYKMEKSDTHLLLTVKYSGISEITGLGLFDRGPVIIPLRESVKIFNLSTGKLIFKKNSKFWRWKKPKLLLVDDYVIFQTEDSKYNDDRELANIGTRVFKMNDKGELNAYTITVEKLILQIAEERNMIPNEYETWTDRTSGIKSFTNNSKSFTYYASFPSDYYFGFVDKIDSAAFLKNIPKNMHLKNHAFTLDKFPEGTTIEDLKAAGYSVERIVDKHEYEIYPVNRKEEYPLQEDFSLYGVKLENDKEEHFHGLYDALENKWIIHPIEKDNFYSTHYKNYVGTYIFTNKGKVFYNIKTRKKYTNLFEEKGNYFTFPYLVYYGYYRDEYEKRYNKKYEYAGQRLVEDF